MTTAELDRKAIEVATRALSKGFDWQAYLVLKAATSLTQSTTASLDVVPESRADEGMAEVINCFVKYADCKRNNYDDGKTIKSLEQVAEKLCQVIIEIYHLCGSEEERKIVYKIKNCLP